MGQSTDFTVRLKGDESGYSASLKKARQATSEFNSGITGSRGTTGSLSSASVLFSATAAAATAFAGTIAAGSATMLAALRTFDQYEQRQLRVQQLLKTTGYAAGLTAEQLEKQASSVALATLASVDGIADAQSVLLTFKSVSGDTFLQAIELSQDMAAVFGGTAKDKALQLGKALESPTEGINALKRSGVSFTAAQRDLIKSLEESGQKAEAQRLILRELQSQVGGSGAAQAGGLAGSIDTISQRWDEFKIALVTSTDANSMAEKLLNTLAKGLDRVSKSIAPDADAELNKLVARRLELKEEMQALGSGEHTGVMSWLVGTKSERYNVEREYEETTARIKQIQEQRKKEQIAESEAVAASEAERVKSSNALQLQLESEKAEKAKKEAAQQAAKDASALDAMRKTLADRRELEQIYYTEREEELKQILARGNITDQEYQQLSLENYQNYQEKLTEIQKSELEAREKAKSDSQRLSELQLLQAVGMETAAAESAYISRQEKLQEALDKRLLTEQQFNDLSSQSSVLYYAEMADAAASSFSSVNDHFLSALEASGKKRSTLYKAMFAAQKLAAIPSIIVDTQKAAMAAVASLPGTPGIVLSKIIQGMGAASVGIVAGQTIAGAYENGGIIPGSSYSGDNLLARVNSREMIINDSQQRRLFDIANGAQPAAEGGNSQIVQVINASSGTTTSQQKTTDSDGNQITQVLIHDLDTDGSIAQRLMTKFRLNPYGN